MRVHGNQALAIDHPAQPLVRLGRSRQAERFAPANPQVLADLGLSASLLEQLIFKFLYFRGDMLAGDLSREMGLRFSFIQPLIESFRMQQFVQVKSSLGLGAVSSLLALTDSGRKIARDYLENNQYIGPAPVPLNQYAEAVKAQRMPPHWLRPERLAKAYSHMVMSEALLDQIGPAVSSGKSLLLYGQPGNGKTYVAEALANIQTTDVYIPFALEYQGNIIQLFDPTCHHPVQAPAEHESDCESDGRWVRCRRPFLMSGGELSVSMLDLTYNPVSRVYDAPLQLKANNGVYLVDDFGRQMSSPSEILNRWIVPMDRRVDYLSLASGGKMTAPFETFLVFSTNLNPAELGDEAFLRRIQYKVLLRSPDEEEFRSIFRNYCEQHGLQPSTKLLDGFIEKHFRRTGKAFRRCHPRDLIAQALDHIHYRHLPHELTEDLLERAFEGCFLQANE